MMNSLISTNNISFILVFLEGIISFFSPCIVPLIPVYMSYLAGNTNETSENGKIKFNRKKVFLHTVFFVLGISFAFFVLGMTFTTLGTFFKNNRLLFTRIAGILIIVLGLFQLGIFEIKFLNIERKFHLQLNKRKANPLIAFILGFTFSFAWTPCVGPALSSVLILASSSSNYLIGNSLVLLYTLGFIIPFLLLGLFTTQILNFLDNYRNILKYTVKIGAIILIIMGIMIFTGWMNGITSYLNSFNPPSVSEKQEELEEAPNNNDLDEENEEEIYPADDFTLIDQYGNEHTLSDYKGKVVFLNFWATWCPPCRSEMPDIETIYNEYGQNQGDVIILGVANPRSEDYTNTKEVDKEGVIKFLEENNITFPVLFDETGDIFSQYGVLSLPTTYFIDKEGNFYGFASGMISKDIMKNTIEDIRQSID